MAKLKKAHRELLKSKNLTEFYKDFDALLKNYDLNDFNINLSFVHKSSLDEACVFPNEWVRCIDPGGKSKMVCLAPGESCPGKGTRA